MREDEGVEIVIDFNRDFAELAEKEKSGVWGRALASLNNWKAIYFGVEWPKAAWSPCDDGDRDFLMLFAGPHSRGSGFDCRASLPCHRRKAFYGMSENGGRGGLQLPGASQPGPQ